MKKRKFISFLFIFILLLFTQGCTSSDNDSLYNKREELVKDEVKIKVEEVNEIAKFYPVMVDDIKMEIIAVRATDGTVRIAFNACQVCADSGKGHYVQEGQYLICQNCGTKFSVDQIGLIKGGCNPAPISTEEKYEEEGFIIIPNETLQKYKELFIY